MKTFSLIAVFFLMLIPLHAQDPFDYHHHHHADQTIFDWTLTGPFSGSGTFITAPDGNDPFGRTDAIIGMTGIFDNSPLTFIADPEFGNGFVANAPSGGYRLTPFGSGETDGPTWSAGGFLWGLLPNDFPNPTQGNVILTNGTTGQQYGGGDPTTQMNLFVVAQDSPVATPEPKTWALVIVGLAGILVAWMLKIR
jgi:hypothetical protein